MPYSKGKKAKKKKSRQGIKKAVKKRR